MTSSVEEQVRDYGRWMLGSVEPVIAVEVRSGTGGAPPPDGGSRRRWGVLVGAAAALAVVTAVAWPDGGDQPSQVVVGSEPSTTVDAAPSSTTVPVGEAWVGMSAAPLSGRSRAVSAWTGEELIVWGGNGAFSDSCVSLGGGPMLCGEPRRTDGAAYDPQADRWRLLPPAPLVDDGGSLFGTYGGVWTGSELVVWGDSEGGGAAYDPITDRWRSIADPPVLPRFGFSMTWTGSEVVIVGGAHLEALDEAVAYDPSTDSWRSLPAPGVGRIGHLAIAVGEGDLLVLGGQTPGGPPVRAVQRFDAGSDTWSAASDVPMATVAAAVWTGEEVVAVGSSDEGAATAASYDPANDVWEQLPAPPIPAAASAALAWTGDEVVAFLAPSPMRSPDAAVVDAAFDPSTGQWRELAPSGLTPRSGSTVAWTGSEVLVWGGERHTGFASEPRADGARYRPDPR